MFNLFKINKQRRQYIEGLALLEDGIKVQLDCAEWHLAGQNLSEEEIIRYTTLKRHCEYVLKEINAIWEGKLHY